MMRSAHAHAPTQTISTSEPVPVHVVARAELAPRRGVEVPVVDERARLEAFDLSAAPDEATAVIHDLAAGGGDDAARTLARWLREETRRDAADARGNVPNLIEALGTVGGDLAVGALLDALDDQRHDLALKTLIVQQLGAIGTSDARALRAVDRFALVAEGTAVHDELDAELRDEALAAADESGRRLRH
jgi:hypothetical protein